MTDTEKLSRGFSGALRTFAFWIANGTVGQPLLEGIDYRKVLLAEPGLLEQVMAIFANVIELDDQGDPVNAKYAEFRAAQWIRSYCDPNYEAKPDWADGEMDLHGPPPRDDPKPWPAASAAVRGTWAEDAIAKGLVYVLECAGPEIQVVARSNVFLELLVNRGFRLRVEGLPDDAKLFKKTTSEAEKARELSKLRDLGIPFSGGKEWNPQEVFEHLRDRGLVGGPYRAIGWLRPGRHVFEDR